VRVVRGGPDKHLERWDGEVIFDAVALHRDFRQSYEAHARRYILDHARHAQRRVDELVENGRKKASRHLAALPAKHFPENGLARRSRR